MHKVEWKVNQKEGQQPVNCFKEKIFVTPGILTGSEVQKKIFRMGSFNLESKNITTKLPITTRSSSRIQQIKTNQTRTENFLLPLFLLHYTTSHYITTFPHGFHLTTFSNNFPLTIFSGDWLERTGWARASSASSRRMPEPDGDDTSWRALTMSARGGNGHSCELQNRREFPTATPTSATGGRIGGTGSSDTWMPTLQNLTLDGGTGWTVSHVGTATLLHDADGKVTGSLGGTKSESHSAKENAVHQSINKTLNQSINHNTGCNS